MKLTKRPEGDGTFTLLDGSGHERARGLSEGDADARIASAAGTAGPADGTGPEDGKDAAGSRAARDGGKPVNKAGKAAREGKDSR